MMTKTKIALAAALVAATSSVAFAQEFDPNLANRYPAYANPIVAAPQTNLRTAPVQLREGRNVSLSTGQIGPSGFEIDRSDRASSPYAGGGF
jgi:hypothetical protein